MRSKGNQTWGGGGNHFHASSTIQVLIISIMRLFFFVRSPSTFPSFMENMMCFNKRSSFPVEPLMSKQRVSNFNANQFLWTRQTRATLLFIYLSIFHHVLGGKLGHRKAASSLVCHDGFPFTKTGFMSVRSGVPFLFLLLRLQLSSTLFEAVWKTVISVCGSNNMEARRRRDTASYVRNPDDKYSMRYRAEDYRRSSSFEAVCCLFVRFLSSSSCRFKEASSRMGKYTA